MKTIKIVFANGGYVGRILDENGGITYETPPCRDAVVASRALTNYNNKQLTDTKNQISVKSVLTNKSTSPKRCCGSS